MKLKTFMKTGEGNVTVYLCAQKKIHFNGDNFTMHEESLCFL